MIPYKVVIKRSAEKEISKLPVFIIEKMYEVLNGLSADPKPYGVKKLTGHKDLYRVRVNDYRIIYTIQNDELVILILKVGHRKDIYK